LSSTKYNNYGSVVLKMGAKTEPTVVVDLKKYCIMKDGF
jgi:hypothetical protein